MTHQVLPLRDVASTLQADKEKTPTVPVTVRVFRSKRRKGLETFFRNYSIASYSVPASGVGVFFSSAETSSVTVHNVSYSVKDL